MSGRVADEGVSAETPVVLVTSRSFGSGSMDCAGQLEQAGLRMVRGPADHDLDALHEALAESVAWIAGTGSVKAEHLDAAPRLRIVARYGVGVDAVDLAAAAERGVTVTNTPGANTEAVADHALALLLAVVRGVPAGDRRVRAGQWAPWRGRELGALRVGVCGFGRIGRAVADRLAGFGTAVLAADPFVEAAHISEAGVTPVGLDELPARCDAVSLHAPGGQTIVTGQWLDLAEAPLVLVNTARADLVDEPAVAAALRSGRVAGYAADTLAGESAGPPSPLLADDLADRVVVTPHVAAQTVEAIDRMGTTATACVLAVLAGRVPDHVVRPEPT
jgi:D-3-phosphoglycerate dehydrogenase / 2-oxoglutarate reductase